MIAVGFARLLVLQARLRSCVASDRVHRGLLDECKAWGMTGEATDPQTRTDPPLLAEQGGSIEGDALRQEAAPRAGRTRTDRRRK